MAERRAVEHAVRAIPNLLRRQDDLRRLEIPPPEIEPISCLAAPKTDGLKCGKCSFVTRQVQTMQAHCRDKHGWHNPRCRGRPTEKNVRWCGQHQRFFPSRGGSRWFEVGRTSTRHRTPAGKAARQCKPSSGKNAEPIGLAPDVSAHLRNVLERDQRYRSAENQPRVYSKAMGEGTFAATSPWLDRTHWPAMFEGCRRDILRAMTRLPNRNPSVGEYVLDSSAKDPRTATRTF
ncbi:hypothetical protein HIM_10477 [Hirsutella minnesotensis 3608]|uniref:Uncharacterized protein n=1 Tax=Hirsutella minnesotensis 3608 TaxID=1043627 RepID=A0A0F7ZG22_9HYPO|nr:hypothetical protein HIM_10477 [Hirsutella minnesotensis 3608]